MTFPLTTFPLMTFPLTTFPLTTFPLTTFPLTTFPLTRHYILNSCLYNFWPIDGYIDARESSSIFCMKVVHECGHLLVQFGDRRGSVCGLQDGDAVRIPRTRGTGQSRGNFRSEISAELSWRSGVQDMIIIFGHFWPPFAKTWPFSMKLIL
jgi:hypothetical protein